MLTGTMFTEARPPAAAPAVTVRPGGCAGCTLCCKVMGVPSLKKAADVWCQHCKTGAGCGIYDARPVECINFICGFLSMPVLGEEWRPATSKLILDTQTAEGTMIVYVDPSRPDAWRRQPYYTALKNWARGALASNGRIVVRTGARSIMIMPDHAVDLGAIRTDEVLVVLSTHGARGNGPPYQVYVAKADVWERVGLEVQQGTRIPSFDEGFRAGQRLD